MPIRTLLTACMTLLALSACIPQGYVKHPSPLLARVDWSAAERRVVHMSEYAFNPQAITFEQNHAYVLEIKNDGSEKHYFSAEKFLKAVATRNVQVPEVAEVKAVRFTDFEVYPGQSVEVYFVADRPGTYPLSCTLPGHADKGMTGALRITAAPKAN